MNKKGLLLKLQNIANVAKAEQEKRRIAVDETKDPLTYESMAKTLVSGILSKENLFAVAKRGAMSISVLPLKAWVSPLQLDPWQQAIFDEIRFHGFEPRVISRTENDNASISDYYIGIQWRNL